MSPIPYGLSLTVMARKSTNTNMNIFMNYFLCFGIGPSADDLRPTAFGRRHSAFGLRPKAFSLLPSAEGLRPSAFVIRPTAFGRWPSAEGLRPSAYGLHITYGLSLTVMARKSTNTNMHIFMNYFLCFGIRPSTDGFRLTSSG